MADRSAKCQRCGHLFKVPDAAVAPTAAKERKSEKPVAQAPPEYIGTFCRVCQTRLFGRPNQVGKPLKCPDCGAETILKAPVVEKAKSLPAALEGEQYELWDADSAPLPSELIAAQPKYVAINCRLCGTLMHATESQVGTELTCPDCKTRTRVEAATIPKTPRQVLVPDDEAYQLDEAFAPTERPAVIQTEYKGMLYEQEREAELTRQAVKSAQCKKAGHRTDVRGRPILPRWPLLKGILKFAFSLDLIGRWLAMSTGLLVAGFIFAESAIAWATWNGGDAGAKAAFAGLVGTLIGAVALLIWLAYVSSVLANVVAESSDGHERVHRWPAMSLMESMADFARLIVALSICAGIGFALGQALALIMWQRAMLTIVSLWLLFPVVYLSQLLADSAVGILSVPLLSAMLRRPFSTLLLYVESALLFAISLAPIPLAASVRASIPILFAPLFVAGALLYARLLGRLGWVLAEASTKEEPNESDNALRATNPPIAHR